MATTTSSDRMAANQHISQQGNGLAGKYKGVVRKQMADGRVKVFVPGIYDSQLEADGMEDFLPNAEIMFPVFAKSINQSGFFGVPDVGAIVFVEFLNQDANYPLVVGTLLNSVPGFGGAVFDSMTTRKKYTKQVLKNGNTEITMDENGSIDISVQSMEGGADENGTLKEARITIDRQNATNRIAISADDIVLDARNILLKGMNIQIDADSKIILHGRGGRVDVMSPSIMLNANVGQGTNAVVVKGAAGTTVM